jgi:hypothetical protein
MEVRFVHNVVSYNASHVLELDYISFDKQVTDSETASAIAAIKAQTDQLTFLFGHLDAHSAALATTVATADTATSFTLTAGLATADAYNGMAILVHDATDGHEEVRRIVDYTAARVVTVDRAFGFTPAALDPISILAIYEAGYVADDAITAAKFDGEPKVDVGKWDGHAVQAHTVEGVPIVQLRNAAGDGGVSAGAGGVASETELAAVKIDTAAAKALADKLNTPAMIEVVI